VFSFNWRIFFSEYEKKEEKKRVLGIFCHLKNIKILKIATSRPIWGTNLGNPRFKSE